MENQLKKNRNLILVIFAMSILPFCIAWVITLTPQILTSRTNLGDLITPVVTTERSELTGFDQFSIDNINELRGHWVIINIIQGKLCDALCLQSMYKTRQLRLMLNKDLTRTRRAVLIYEEVDPVVAATWWENDTRLLRIVPSKNLITKIQTAVQGEIPDGTVFIMDPLGNFMMRYEPGFDPYDVKKDLHKLLKISQIG